VLLQPAAKATIEQFGATTTAYKLTYWMADPLWTRFNPEDISLS